MPTVSVIVPVYNAEKHLYRCIDSLLSQSFTDFELILVDDGSPDNCPAICDEYAAKDPRVVVIHKKNGGVSSARNAGLDIANGKYITFCDSDDYVSDAYLEELLPEDCELSICAFKLVDENSIATIYEEQFISGTFPVNSTNVGYWFDQGYLYSVWRCMFHNRIIRSNNIHFDLNTFRGEDTIFVLSYLEHCNSVKFCSDAMYYYVRYGSGTLTTNCNPTNLLALAYLDNYLYHWFVKTEVKSLCYEKNHFWTRQELRDQFYGTLRNPNCSFKDKYALAKAFCNIPDYNFFLARFFKDEHPKYIFLMKTRCPFLISLYHIYILK